MRIRIGKAFWIPLVATCCAGWVLLFGVRATHRPFRVPTGSMQPNLLPGDCLYARNLGSRLAVTRGSVVVYLATDGTHYMHRCAAVAGDTVEVRDGIVLINGNVYESALDDADADHSCVPSSPDGGDCPEPHTLLVPGARGLGPQQTAFGPVVVPATTPPAV